LDVTASSSRSHSGVNGDTIGFGDPSFGEGNGLSFHVSSVLMTAGRRALRPSNVGLGLKLEGDNAGGPSKDVFNLGGPSIGVNRVGGLSTGAVTFTFSELKLKFNGGRVGGVSVDAVPSIISELNFKFNGGNAGGASSEVMTALKPSRDLRKLVLGEIWDDPKDRTDALDEATFGALSFPSSTDLADRREWKSREGISSTN